MIAAAAAGAALSPGVFGAGDAGGVVDVLEGVEGVEGVAGVVGVEAGMVRYASKSTVRNFSATSDML